MASALNIAMTSIDVHGGYSVENLQKDLEAPLESAKTNPNRTHLVFLDEINTSPEIGAFKEVVCDHSLKGQMFPDNLVIIAALNPHRTRHKTDEDLADEKDEERNVTKHYLDDLDKEMCQLVYRVFPLPKSLQTYVWNFGSLSQHDEQQYIAVMTTSTWSKKEFVDNIEDLKNTPKVLDSLKLFFINAIFTSQNFVREKLKDQSVCSLRDVRRANTLFLWFFNNREGKKTRTSVIEAMILSLAQCYYYRLTKSQRKEYENLVEQLLKKLNTDIQFGVVVENEQQRHDIFFFVFCVRTQLFAISFYRYVRTLDIPPGIAKNRAFCENLFVMLVGLATKTPTIVVGRPGSSKTLAMAVVQSNLSSSSKSKGLTEMNFDDFFVVSSKYQTHSVLLCFVQTMLFVSFQCSKLTTADLIRKRWENAVGFQEKLKLRFSLSLFFSANVDTTLCANTNRAIPSKKQSGTDEKEQKVENDAEKTQPKSNRSVVLWLDEVGLAEQSPHRPLKILHKLLEDDNRQIAFIGLSNWRLDSAKMNRMVLHQVMQPDTKELVATADEIINEKLEGENANYQQDLSIKVPKIAELYNSIMTDHEMSPFKFDFYGYRDFYSLASYLKYSCQMRGGVSRELLVEAVMRNFGGMTKEQTEEFLFPKIAKYFYGNVLPKPEIIWKQFSPLHLIRNNIEQSRDIKRPEMRNIMLITESPVMWKILFDSGITTMESTEVIFGSKFAGDINSTIYLYRTIEKVRNAMSTGKICVLLKLEQLYDSLYDILNQRYQSVDGQKFCRICIGGESIRCRIAKTFRCVVVVSRAEAFHETKNHDLHTPVAFLNRFEKFFLDPSLLEQYSLDPLWKSKFDKLQKTIAIRFSDRLQLKKSALFVGFLERYTYISLLINEATSRKNESNEEKKYDTDNEEAAQEVQIDQIVQNCLRMLLQNTSLQILIDDKKRQRDFIPYADIVLTLSLYMCIHIYIFNPTYTYILYMFFFLDDTSKLDVLEREGANEKNEQVLIKVVTHDFQLLDTHVLRKGNEAYVITRDDLLNSSYIPKSVEDLTTICTRLTKDTKQVSQTTELTEIRFKDLRDFVQETDLFTYVFDFLRDVSCVLKHSVLVIACDPLMSESMLMHYLHVQYLVEKAFVANQKSSNETKAIRPKRTFVMLFYSNRVASPSKGQDPVLTNPLVFNSLWKHVFVDALLPANSLNEVQINDINVFEPQSLTQIQKRIEPNSFKLLADSYELALNFINFGRRNQTEFCDEIHTLRTYLNADPPDNGELQEVLNGRLQDVLLDTETGATYCLKTVLKQQLRERGSLRSEFMSNLAQKIKNLLVEILCVIFENGNSLLYRRQKDERIDNLFLRILSEPKIVRVTQREHREHNHEIVPKDDIPGGGRFPFSSHLHAFVSSFREVCFEVYERMKQDIRESLVEFLIVQIHTSIQTSGLKISLNRLSMDLIKRLLHDVVLLESSGTLGLRRFSKDAHVYNTLVNHVCLFVEKASMEALQKFGASKETKRDFSIPKDKQQEEKEDNTRKKNKSSIRRQQRRDP
ncbi:hypothetical protein RFI_39478 [Reticulomyxa filosa]|uniref:ATPase AAA-type core domain-containing protein n=1 Tax=Reticulomyxa filosa TaxID=46433 RepID=X6L947_RETFI|nr:hypothetical protein RFI_39478 [Reticulomyxa filosa]|eukprot:ETN98043.1 hypothetical protein RFI_39478 [Reticulomyxa filosa]